MRLTKPKSGAAEAFFARTNKFHHNRPYLSIVLFDFVYFFIKTIDFGVSL